MLRSNANHWHNSVYNQVGTERRRLAKDHNEAARQYFAEVSEAYSIDPQKRPAPTVVPRENLVRAALQDIKRLWDAGAFGSHKRETVP